MKSSEIISLVATFVVRQLAKYGAENLDWSKVRTDLNERVIKLVPGDMFDPFAQALVGKIVDLLEVICKEPKVLAEIKAAIATKKFGTIIAVLVAHTKKQLVA